MRPGWSTRLRIAFVVAALLAIVVLVGLAANGDEDERRDERIAALIEQSTPHEVIYQVTGDATVADITVETPTGTSQQSVDVPLTNKGGTPGLRFKFRPGAFVYISAQQKSGGPTITCQITVDGIVISSNTSTGRFQIASCKGTA